MLDAHARRSRCSACSHARGERHDVRAPPASRRSSRRRGPRRRPRLAVELRGRDRQPEGLLELDHQRDGAERVQQAGRVERQVGVGEHVARRRSPARRIASVRSAHARRPARSRSSSSWRLPRRARADGPDDGSRGAGTSRASAANALRMSSIDRSVPEHVERAVGEQPAARAEMRAGVGHEVEILVRIPKVQPRHAELLQLAFPALVEHLSHAARERR